jgi:hypothetical protein
MMKGQIAFFMLISLKRFSFTAQPSRSDGHGRGKSSKYRRNPRNPTPAYNLTFPTYARPLAATPRYQVRQHQPRVLLARLDRIHTPGNARFASHPLSSVSNVVPSEQTAHEFQNTTNTCECPLSRGPPITTGARVKDLGSSSNTAHSDVPSSWLPFPVPASILVDVMTRQSHAQGMLHQRRSLSALQEANIKSVNNDGPCACANAAMYNMTIRSV